MTYKPWDFPRCIFCGWHSVTKIALIQHFEQLHGRFIPSR